MLSTLLIASVIIEAVRTKLPSVYQMLAWPATGALITGSALQKKKLMLTSSDASEDLARTGTAREQ